MKEKAIKLRRDEYYYKGYELRKIYKNIPSPAPFIVWVASKEGKIWFEETTKRRLIHTIDEEG